MINNGRNALAARWQQSEYKENIKIKHCYPICTLAHLLAVRR